jgi:phage shock protein PspC (stress-responsive transcriptional regulator)
MTTNTLPLYAREDTMFGICQGVGEDLGIAPNLIRIALALSLFLSPVGAIVAYVALGVVVLASRLLFPTRRRGGAEVDQPAIDSPIAGNDGEMIEYKQAA